VLLAGCVAPEPEPAQKPYFWRLMSIDGVPFAAGATLAIDDGRAFGQGPCNSWTGKVYATPFPEWRIRDVVATELACDDLPAEARFLAAMDDMTHAAVGIGDLDLVDQKGRAMKFVPLAP